MCWLTLDTEQKQLLAKITTEMLCLGREGKDTGKNPFNSNTSHNTARTKEETTYLSTSNDPPQPYAASLCCRAQNVIFITEMNHKPQYMLWGCLLQFLSQSLYFD